ncbi:MAG: TonB-dependent receptor [Campylobacter sp.]|nr:TonB-dependent receptor [Campylobacter sp.]
MCGNKLRLSLIALLILNGGGLFGANENDVKLDSIEVVGTAPDDDIKTKKVGETKKSAKTLERQQVQDSKDLVKYETGVTVVEAGRFGSSGYAIRGVDENRVAITIDGLRQSETLSSQGFKELFEGYGNFNNTRNGIEIENVKEAIITKGSDSIKTGSGSLGGSVMFETKDARDYLIDKDWYLSFKNGYSSRDSQNFRSLSAAARYKWFDILIVNTLRSGHETKNYYYDIYSDKEDKYQVGREREKADPYDITRKSTMVKVGFSPSDEHRFSIMRDDSTLSSSGEDLSYSLRSSQYIFDSYKDSGYRKNNDKSTRKNTQFAYENFTETPFWDNFKLSYSDQKIKNKARTDEYCDNDRCAAFRNPNGLNLKLGDDGVYKVVDKNGQELTPIVDTSGWWTDRGFKDSDGNSVEYKDNGGKIYNTFIDCSKVDCTKKFRVSVWDSATNTHTFEDRDIEIKQTPNGITYGAIKKNSSYEDAIVVIPQSAGYAQDIYHDRDLDTDTKQFDINFEKEFELFKTEHSLKYGGLWDKTKKSMLDQDGYKGYNAQWWADSFFGSEYDYYDPNAVDGYVLHPDWYYTAPIGQLKSVENRKQTFLIPVETKTGALKVGDNITVTDWLGLDLNYRYDRVEHRPSYNEDIPVPTGMIVGVFKPLPPGFNPYQPGIGYNNPTAQQNLKENLEILLQNRKFRADSYSFGLNLDPLDWLRIQLKYAKGFRAPTSDEMYMTFKHPNFSIRPNVLLNAEISKTKEIAVSFYRNISFASFSYFKTDYDNFIDLVYIGDFAVDGSSIPYPFYQNKNRDSAEVKGFEINSHLELEEILPSLRGFRIGYKFTRQKGRMDETIPMNAIQPTTSVYNLGYSTLGDKYGIDFYITDVGAKKAQDTYNMYWETQRDNYALVKGQYVTDSTLAYRSGNYTVIDMIAYARPTKNFTFGFGLYNITDEKYVTWDSARSIRSVGTNNLINQNTGAGFKRFFAPGRNFKFTWSITF